MAGDSSVMKRAYLIAGGTLGGLGAVLAITPPQLSSSESALGTDLNLAPVGTAATTEPATTSTTKAATSEPAPAATKTATASKDATVTKGATPSQSATQTPAPVATKSATATPTPAAASSKSQSGTFTGDPYTMRYGTVQVKITIANGKITDAVAVQAPAGRDQRFTDMAIPVMRQKTLAAQSANITGVSGASYTAYAWYISLQSALSKAGWM
jgi:uncharacterized protein with FMN-binding domain